MVITIDNVNYTIFEKENLVNQLKGIIDDNLLEIITPALNEYDQVLSLRKENGKLEEEITVLEENIEDLEGQVDSRDNEIFKLEDEISSLYNKLNEKNKEIQRMRKIING